MSDAFCFVVAHVVGFAIGFYMLLKWIGLGVLIFAGLCLITLAFEKWWKVLLPFCIAVGLIHDFY